MTDATHAVTQSALETFTREYLTSLGASIREEDGRWNVRLPAHVDIGFSDQNEFQIVLGDTESGRHQSESVLTPESEFAQRLLDEAAEMAPVGQMSFTDQIVDSDYRYPPWITEGRVEVVDATFNPYYDRMGICVFVRIGVETVSKYQTQFLEAVALDAESKTHLPVIEKLLVEEFYTPNVEAPLEEAKNTESGDGAIQLNEFTGAISAGQRIAVEEAQEEIDEVRRSASRSADSEFEEYRQLQEQRISELQTEISSLSDRLQSLATDVDSADSQQQRVKILEKRQELQEEKEDLEAELQNILQEKERGYLQKQREIYERHAINVNTNPVAVTLLTYERGELDLTVAEEGRTSSIRTPYAIGGGVTDEVRCDNCHEQLSEENPVHLTTDGIGCQNCW